MKYIVLSIIGLGVVVVGFILFSKPSISNSTVTQLKGAAPMEFGTVLTSLQNGGLLLDVRTPEEFDQGHISQATLFPLDKLQSGSMPTAEKNTPLYVYCRSGNRSAQAKRILDQAGFTQVIDLGGINDVAERGGAIVKI